MLVFLLANKLMVSSFENDLKIAGIELCKRDCPLCRLYLYRTGTLTLIKDDVWNDTYAYTKAY